ncbi:MAG: hypothetical protein SGJ27_30730, partial [Candidatus Melainabacteria bacterium]|nr:hypothetical protein [Candidatus Melainabacteria bacterium]
EVPVAPKVEPPVAKPAAEVPVAPKVEPPVAKPVAEVPVAPKVEPVAKPAAEVPVAPKVEPPVAKPAAEVPVAPKVEPPVAKPAAEVPTAPKVEPQVAKPAAEVPVAPKVEPPVAKPATALDNAKPVEVPAAVKLEPRLVTPAGADDAAKLVPAKPISVALENGTKSIAATGDEISVSATRLGETTAKAVKGDLDEIARLGKDLGKGDDVATLANINERLANISRTAGKEVADDVARTMKPALQKAEAAVLENSSLKLANAVESNARILVSTGDDISREVGKLAPKLGTAAQKDADEIARLAQNLGKGGDDLLTVRTINEHIANISKTAGKDAADDVARALKPGLQKAENVAIETNTLRSVTKIEQRVTRLADDMAGPEAAALRKEVASIQQNTQKLIAGTDDAVATANIERSIANLEAAGAKTKYADDIAKLTQDTRELQSTVSVSRRVAAIESNSSTLATTGTKLSDDAVRLAADPLKVAAKADLDEIARLGQTLGKGGDDVAAVTKINEKLSNISRTLGTDAADDVARALKPTVQRVEAAAVENGALRSAANLEQRIARVAESVTGPEAAAIRQNLTALQQSTRGFVNSADNAAAHSEDVSRALQTLERSGAKTNVADDIAKISRETRDVQVSVNASRRVSAIETTTKTLINDGKAIGDEVAKLATVPGRAAKADLDEISRLSNNLGRTGDDLETIRKINEKVAAITKTGGAGADDVSRALTTKVQKAEATALETNRLKAIDKVATTVEAEARTLSNTARDLAKVADTTTTKGRVLQQELKAIQRAADELPTSVKPATDATRLRTMVAAVEKTEPKLAVVAKTIDTAAGDLTALRTLGNQTARVERAAANLRGTVAQVSDDLAAGTTILKPGTAPGVRNALTTIDRNAAVVESKLGTTARVDREIREIRVAINALEEAGQKPLAQQLSRQFRELDNANTVRSYEITSHQGPALANFGYKQNLIVQTIDQVGRDVNAINAWGNLTGKVDVINDAQQNLQMLRFIAKNDTKLIGYVEDTQLMLSRMELAALSKGGRAVERSWTNNLLALAESGNQQAVNRLFVNGLQSDGWRMRSLANAPQSLSTRLGLAGVGRVVTRPEFWSASTRTLADASLLTFGLTTLYANYKYHTQLMLKAIEAQMAGAAPAANSNDILRDAKQPADTKNGGGEVEQNRYQGQPIEVEPRQEAKADLDFTPAVAQITRRINLSPASESVARLYGIATDDPNAQDKVEDLIQTGKIRHWSGLGGINVAPEQEVKMPVIQTAKSIRIKGPDGTTYDPSNRPKTAITSFSFTRAMELTNQIKLMTAAPEQRSTAKSGTIAGGSAAGASLSQNLRTMVNFNSVRTESGTTKVVQHIEGTEEGGVDPAGSGVASVPQGPQVGGMPTAGAVDPMRSNISTGAIPPTANTVSVGTGNSSTAYIDNSFLSDESREAV